MNTKDNYVESLAPNYASTYSEKSHKNLKRSQKLFIYTIKYLQRQLMWLTQTNLLSITSKTTVYKLTVSHKNYHGCIIHNSPKAGKKTQKNVNRLIHRNGQME